MLERVVNLVGLLCSGKSTGSNSMEGRKRKEPLEHDFGSQDTGCLNLQEENECPFLEENFRGAHRITEPDHQTG